MVDKASGLHSSTINITARLPVEKATGNPSSKRMIRELNIRTVIISILMSAPFR
jgi:hypothetical protein